MTKAIHPTAIIEDGAQVAASARIGPYCMVSAGAVLGDNVVLHSHVAIAGHTTIGADTQVYPFASLGHPPQDLKYKGEKSELLIGKNNVIREHVTMNPGTAGGGLKTIIGDNCLFMSGAHIAHDCRIGNHVIMATHASLGGHVSIGDHAVLGGLSGVHQFVRIGEYAVIGGLSGVENDIIPFGRAKGDRAFLAGLNLVGLERSGFTKDQIRNLQRAFNQLFGDEGTFEERLDTVEKEFAAETQVRNIIKFAREKTRFPLCQPPKKAA